MRLRVAFLGPDGSGKSTVIAAMHRLLSSEVDCTIRCYHFKIDLGRKRSPVFQPYQKKAHNPFISFIKVLYWLGVYTVWGMMGEILRQHMHVEIAVFDRFLYDIAADPKRYRIHPLISCLPIQNIVWPRPHIVFILRANVQILQQRKKEVSVDESMQQLQNYQSLFQGKQNVMWLDSSKDIEDLANASAKEIMRICHTLEMKST